MHLSTHRLRRSVAAALPALALAVSGLLAAGPTAQAAAPPTPHTLSARDTQNARALQSPQAQAVHSTGTAGAHVPTEHLCGAPVAGRFSCLAQRRTDIAMRRDNTLSPEATPSGLGPANLHSAYNLPSTGGSGLTVAIVDAYDDPNAATDLSTYRSQYGLSACTTANGCFKKVGQTGSTTNLPSPDSGWAGEIALDLDMVSAACPSCNILLVEADSASMEDLGTAVNEAVALGAKFVSNSYGGDEESADPSYDSAYFNHPGVAITVSAGDAGYGAEYPAASRYVTAVGGTSLNTSSTTRGWTEKVWGTTSGGDGTGSGCSAYDTKPTWQTDTGCARRTVADVSAVADPATGVAVYDTYGGSGWAVYGGTSASSPLIAGVYALGGAPAAGSNPASYPYAHTANLYDVTTGANGSCSSSYLCTAKSGYDGPTGLGTPNGVTAFKNGTSSGNTVTVTNPGSQTGTVGTARSLQIAATDSAGAALTYSASGLPAGLSVNASTGLVSGTPTTAGTYQTTVTASDSTGASGSASFGWTIAPAGGGTCTAGQLLANPGFESGATGWTASSGVVTNDSGEAAHGGSYKAWLDGYGSTHTDTLSQSVTVPAGCKATLTFWLHIDTAETTTTSAYDKLTVTAGSTTLATYSNLNKATGYAQKSFDLSSFAGSTVTLKFSGTEDSSLQTSFVVDDTALTTG
ncbi:putative Ig domain-containing protein [Streptomyces sp. MI02-7b]|uniref:putative Ig domain-containing protein n=1 Tax=Streptomyces sp. MI02-7b TaxID=462941 RepID=UPI0029BCF506|nr:putative Ig domain-containing protein [Streptomyces sp. MI02-7b]MDX3073411.1 putative Ig domain-containing protein [Streptomyces sp. MI02-7b]